jgi:imidazole glycerol-phosphate synthase subunit HisH
MYRIAIIDTGMCNVDSMLRAIEECGAKGEVTNVAGDLNHADKIVLPGVGAFPDAMDMLRSHGLDVAIRDNVLNHGVPILGVCLGMQLLATRGSEVRECDGLNLIAAEVVRLVPRDGERVPHVGWNEVSATSRATLLSGIPDGADFYFVHSFHMVCEDEANVAATTPYCGGITSAVQHEHIFGTQFHPEKSQANGLKLIRNFVESAC